MAEKNNTYELMVIVAPQLMEQKKTPKDAVEALIKRVKGEVLDLDEWGEKTLSYMISGHDKGYYLVYKVSMEPKAHGQFKQRIKLEKGILRWLLIHE